MVHSKCSTNTGNDDEDDELDRGRLAKESNSKLAFRIFMFRV